MQSAGSLSTINSVKLTIKALKIFIFVGSAIYITFSFGLLIVDWFPNTKLTCKNIEFTIQNSMLTLLILVFNYFAYKVTSKIKSDQVRSSSELLGDDDQVLNQTRKIAMHNIWIFLCCLTIVSLESQLYSIFKYFLTDINCKP